MDRSGQKSVDNPAAAVAGWRSVAATPPVAGRGGGDCGGTKHLQKKFFKKSFALVDIKRKNASQYLFQQLHAQTYENEAGNSGDKGSGVDSLRH